MIPFLLLAVLQTAEPPIRPSAALGFEPGADSVLADWRQVSGYMNTLAQQSPFVRVDTLGRTTEGRPFVLMTITSPANQGRLADIKRAQALLADPRRLTDAELENLRARQPAVILISLITGKTVQLGLDPVNQILLVTTLAVASLTCLTGHTNVLNGFVHLVLFVVYFILIFAP